LSNLARKLQEQHVYQPIQQPEVQTVKKYKISRGEKMLALIFILMVSVLSIKIISNQATIYDVNKSIHKTKLSIDSQSRIVADLEDQVDELSTFERIYKQALENGYTMNENNVKVVRP